MPIMMLLLFSVIVLVHQVSVNIYLIFFKIIFILVSVKYNNLGLQKSMGMFCLLHREGRGKMEFQAMRYVSVQ